MTTHKMQSWAVAAFAGLSLWMIVNNRMWECLQCRRSWELRRS